MPCLPFDILIFAILLIVERKEHRDTRIREKERIKSKRRNEDSYTKVKKKDRKMEERQKRRDGEKITEKTFANAR